MFVLRTFVLVSDLFKFCSLVSSHLRVCQIIFAKVRVLYSLPKVSEFSGFLHTLGHENGMRKRGSKVAAADCGLRGWPQECVRRSFIIPLCPPVCRKLFHRGWCFGLIDAAFRSADWRLSAVSSYLGSPRCQGHHLSISIWHHHVPTTSLMQLISSSWIRCITKDPPTWPVIHSTMFSLFSNFNI